jgi:hypothetical protein
MSKLEAEEPPVTFSPVGTELKAKVWTQGNPSLEYESEGHSRERLIRLTDPRIRLLTDRNPLGQMRD